MLILFKYMTITYKCKKCEKIISRLTSLQKLTIVKPVSECNFPLNYIENSVIMANSM